MIALILIREKELIFSADVYKYVDKKIDML